MGERQRSCSLSTLDLYRLDLACLPVDKAWHGRTYLVGSTMTGGDYRDVDVRTILDDDDFDALFLDRPELWQAFCLGMSAWLRAQTALPVDYQVQRRTQANAHHPGPRNPLRGGRRRFAGLGDGTQFFARDEAEAVTTDG